VVLLDPASATCPGCGAALVENPRVEEMSIPGVTVVDPEVKLAEQRAARELARAKAGAVAGTMARYGRSGPLLRIATGSGRRPASQPTGLLPATYEPVPTPDAAPAAEDGAARTDDGPWRDLPPPFIEDQVAGSEWDPWAGVPAGPAPKPNELSTPAGQAPKPNELAMPTGPAPGDPWAAESEERSK
jgi:hypothetical protein